MSANTPLELAAIRALWEELGTAPNVVPVVTALAAKVPELLAEIDRLKGVADLLAASSQAEAWAFKDLVSANQELGELVGLLQDVIENYADVNIVADARSQGLLDRVTRNS